MRGGPCPRDPNPGACRGCRSAAALLLVCGVFALAGTLRAQDGPTEYQASLKGPPADPARLRLLGPDAEACVHFEPEGLRVTLPGNHRKERPFTGLATTFGVRGDFEITVDFKVLGEAEPAPPAEFATRLSLILHLRGEKKVILSRARAAGVQRFVAWRQWPDEAGKLRTQSKFTVTEAPAGRLRLVRTGTRVAYYAAAAPDPAFRLLEQYEVGDEDVKEVRIAGSTGGLQATLDARLTDLTVRTGAPPAAPEPSPRAGGGRIALAVLLGVLVLIPLAVAGWRYARRGRRAAAPAPPAPAKSGKK